MENKNTIIEIKNEDQLPNGGIISYEGDDLKISPQFRRFLVAWKLAEKENTIWVISTRKELSGNATYQLIKDAEAQGYTIERRVVANQAFIDTLYDKKKTNLDQSETKKNSELTGEFETILRDALKERVSDIHIEVTKSGGIIRMRKNGEMREYRQGEKMTNERAVALVSVIHDVLAQNKAVSFDPKDCQQASVSYVIDGIELKLRYQSVPSYPDGFDVIFRLLMVSESEEFTPLDQLGYVDSQVTDLIRITSRSVGSLIIAGVTNSGKSTTMKNLLMQINANNAFRLKVYTIEDPPEYNIPRVTQIPVIIGKDTPDNKGVSPFEKPIKACMRGDPDIIMIGEVRDRVTGDLTKKAVQSGHQVLTTVHAPSALGIIERFDDFDVNRAVLGSPDFLSGLLYQKLMQVLCKNCSIDFVELVKGESVQSRACTQKDVDMFVKIKNVLKKSKKPYLIENFKIRTRSHEGCKECGYTGITGRTVAAEVISTDITMLEYITKGETIELMKYWRGLSDQDPASTNMRGKTVMEHGFLKVLNGIVCPFDLEGSFRPLEEMLFTTGQVDNNEDSDSLVGWSGI